MDVGGAKVKVNGCGIFYQRLGSGSPIVFVHGGMVLDSSNFLPYVAPLSMDHTLIIYDQCGRGRSNERPDISNMTIMDDVADIHGLSKALNLDKITVAGHSWGAIMAALYAQRYRDLIDKLILISPVGAHYPAWQRPWILNTMEMLTPKDRKAFDALLKNKELRIKDPQRYFDLYFSSIHAAWFADPIWAERIPPFKTRARTGTAVWSTLKGYDFRDRFQRHMLRPMSTPTAPL